MSDSTSEPVCVGPIYHRVSLCPEKRCNSWHLNATSANSSAVPKGCICRGRQFNNLGRFHCSDSFEIAHVIVNRGGDLYVGHDLSVPWRSTKFERALNFGTSLKGLFLHVDFIQPRRGAPGHRRNDIAAPTPGFTAVQYDRLALVYTLAS